jgi:hypothetical protein
VFERGTRPADNALSDLWTECGVLDRWLEGLAGYRSAVAGAPLLPVTVVPREEDEDWADDGIFARPEVSRMLAEVGSAPDREAALAAVLRDDPDSALAAACLVAARHSGMAYNLEENEWLADHPLDPTPELVELARSVLATAASTDDVLRLTLEGLDGRRVVPVLADLTMPRDGEKEAKSFVKSLRTGGFFTGCATDADRARILWCTARASDLLGRPVEVTFRGLAANVFIPGFI